MPVALADVLAAIHAVDREAAHRGEMFPQTRDEQRDDRRAVTRVMEMLAWYEKNTGCARIKGWPVLALAAPAGEPEPAGLPITQEPKYTVNGHAIVNRVSGEAIPSDEPVFIFRARDKLAAGVLGDYAEMCEDQQHIEAVIARFIQFSEWAEAHPERMKMPDTAAPPVPAQAVPVASASATVFPLEFLPQAMRPTESGDYLIYNQCDGLHVVQGHVTDGSFDGFSLWAGPGYIDDSFYQAWAKLPDSVHVLYDLFADKPVEGKSARDVTVERLARQAAGEHDRVSDTAAAWMTSPTLAADILLRRAVAQLNLWAAAYGEHEPEWLPPAGDVQLLEDIAAHLHQVAVPIDTKAESTRLARAALGLPPEVAS